MRADSTRSCAGRDSPRRGAGRRLFQDHVRVGPPDAEGAHSGHPGLPVRLPLPKLACSRRRGSFAKSILGFGRSKCRLGGICPCFSASTVLARAATPAARSRWPKLVLTEPMAQKPLRSVPRRKARVRASISMGSPRAVGGAVGLHVADGLRLYLGHRHGLGDGLGLAAHAGRGVAGLLGAVVVDGGAADARRGSRRRRRRASSSRFRTTTPTPLPKTVPPAFSSKVRVWPSGREDAALLIDVAVEIAGLTEAPPARARSLSPLSRL